MREKERNFLAVVLLANFWQLRENCRRQQEFVLALAFLAMHPFRFLSGFLRLLHLLGYHPLLCPVLQYRSFQGPINVRGLFHNQNTFKYNWMVCILSLTIPCQDIPDKFILPAFVCLFLQYIVNHGMRNQVSWNPLSYQTLSIK